MTRPAAALRRQLEDLELFLRSHAAQDPEWAEEWSLARPSLDPLPAPKERRRSPRYEAAVIAMVDALPRHLLYHGAAALRTLPRQDRVVLHLTVVLGHPHTVVAALLRCSAKTVGHRRHLALVRLAHTLYDDEGHPTPIQRRGGG